MCCTRAGVAKGREFIILATFAAGSGVPIKSMPLWERIGSYIPWACHDVTHSYVWRDSFHTRELTHSNWRDSFLRVTWFNHMFENGPAETNRQWLHVCAVTHARVWRDPFICVTWLAHKCDVTNSYTDMAHFLKCASLCGNASAACAVTYAHMWRDSFMRVTSLTYTCQVTHWLICAWPCGDESAFMGWLPLVRSLQL